MKKIITNQNVFEIFFSLFYSMCMSTFEFMLMNMQALSEKKRGCKIPWSWSYRWLYAAWYECWEPKFGPLEEQCDFITTEPLLQLNTSEFYK